MYRPCKLTETSILNGSTLVSIQQKEVAIFQSHLTDGAIKAKTTTNFLFK